MSDEQNVYAGSETSGEQAAAEPSQETAAAETSDASAEQSEETTADAGGAADETAETVDPNASRTDFAAPGLKVGDACKCPDGRKGTVHRYDAGLICIPDQG
jgi:hypothetical protein